MYGNNEVVTCSNPKCKEIFLFEQGQKDQGEFITRGRDGQNLNESKMVFIAQNRFKCSKCNVEQCKVCGEIPYHLGYTCEQFKSQVFCRYCEIEPLDYEVNLQERPLSDICLDPDCYTKGESACQKILPCNHRCSSTKEHGDSIYCFCTKDGCHGNNFLKNVDCSYCTEHLYCGPTVYSTNCGHGFHYQCLKNNLEKKHHTKRITFGYLNCPECRAEIDLKNMKNDDPIRKLLDNCVNEKKNMAELIKKNIYDDININLKELDDENHRFHKKPIEYGFSIYSIYPCFKCKKHFIGGRVACDNPEDGEMDQQSKPEDYLCMGCTGYKQKCDIHGDKNMVWKCKFCCNLALFFCHGNTHYCDPCHRLGHRAVVKDCLGVGKCQLLDGRHEKNGKEAQLGCEMCLGM